MCFPVGQTDFPLSDQELPFWRKIKLFGMKAHEFATRGGSVGAALFHCSVLTVMLLEEETD